MVIATQAARNILEPAFSEQRLVWTYAWEISECLEVAGMNDRTAGGLKLQTFILPHLEAGRGGQGWGRTGLTPSAGSRPRPCPPVPTPGGPGGPGLWPHPSVAASLASRCLLGPHLTRTLVSGFRAQIIQDVSSGDS